MKKILILTFILSQFSILPSWSMGEKMGNPDANQAKEQNQTGQNSATKLDAQDRDAMNQTTGFPGQTNSAVDLDTNEETSLDQEPLDTENQSNLSGQTGKTNSSTGQSSSGTGSF